MDVVSCRGTRAEVAARLVARVWAGVETCPEQVVEQLVGMLQFFSER